MFDWGGVGWWRIVGVGLGGDETPIVLELGRVRAVAGKGWMVNFGVEAVGVAKAVVVAPASLPLLAWKWGS